MIPPRIRPEPLPKIDPRWEFQADGELLRAYEDYKRALQVPWVGVVAMAYARYPAFFRCWWEGLSGVVASKAYVEGAFALRRQIEEKVAALDPPPIAARLVALGYSERELAGMRDIFEFLSHGNFIQGPAVFAARLLMEGGALEGGAAKPEPYGGRHEVHCATPFVLMEPHHAAADTRAVFADVRARLGLPFVNTDYRAMARWPSYFALAWADLSGHLGSPAHEALAREMHEAVFALTASLPNPHGLTAGRLQAAAARDGDGDVAHIRDVTRLFTHLIPGLTVNVAFFRHQLLRRAA